MDFVFPQQPKWHDECVATAPRGTWGCTVPQSVPPPAELISGQPTSSDRATFCESGASSRFINKLRLIKTFSEQCFYID